MAAQVSFADSNIALLSSALNHELKLDAAKQEKNYNGAGQKAGLECWRIEKFELHRWPADKIGQFYSGDAYIVLHSYLLPEQKTEKLNYNAFFWLGKNSTTDEQGTAAYKIVELDDLLGGRPVQFREVQGYESNEFKNLFPHLIYLDGGVESGFNFVKPEEYKPRLMQVVGKKHPQVNGKPMALDSLNDGDVFILDAGLKIWQWNGSKSNPDERREGDKICKAMKLERKSKPTITILDGLENDDEFWGNFGGKPASVHPPIAVDVVQKAGAQLKVFRLSDKNGLAVEKIGEAETAKRSLLTSDDVFIIETGHSVVCWVGSNASKEEKSKAILFATRHLVDHKLPAHMPIVRIIEGSTSKEFDALWN